MSATMNWPHGPVGWTCAGDADVATLTWPNRCWFALLWGVVATDVAVSIAKAMPWGEAA